MGNLVLSVAAIAVIAAIYVNISDKKESIDSQISQTKKVLAYETNEHKINSTSYAKLNVKPSMLFVTNNMHDKELLKKLAKAVTAEMQNNPNAQSFSCSTLAQTKDITLKECEYIQSKHFTTVLPSNQAINTNTQSYLQNNASNPKQQQTLKIATAVTVDKIAPTQIAAINTIKSINSQTQQTTQTQQTQNKKVINIINPKNDAIFSKKVVSLIKRGIVLNNKIITHKKINKKNLMQALALNQNHIKNLAYKHFHRVKMFIHNRYSNYFEKKKTDNLDLFGFSKNMFINFNKTGINNNKTDVNKRNFYQIPQMPYRSSNSFGFGKW